MALTPLEEPTTRRISPNDFALFELGFRPLYLCAAAFAALAVPLWVLALSGHLALPLPGMLWHAHEMLFGFAAAVIVGFLFTAGRNWTGIQTPQGPHLMALVGLWLAGRLAVGLSDAAWSAVVDLLFLPAAALALARVLWRAQNSRNYFVVVLLAALTLANLGFHLARLGMLSLNPLLPLHAALGLIVVLETVIAGRVIPGFTGNTLRGVALRQDDRLNRAAIAMTALALLAWACEAPAPLVAPLCATASALNLARCLGWNPWATRHVPLLWILHLSYFWIPVGLALLAVVAMGGLPASAGIHALAIGATAGLIIGMITRTALGHTGRTLAAGRIETTAYALIHLAAFARVLTLVALPAAALMGIHVAALAWSLAFLLYLYRYGPFLLRARADGKPG